MNEALVRRLQMWSTLPPATTLNVIKLAIDTVAALMQATDCLALDHSNPRHPNGAQILAPIRFLQAIALSGRRLISRMQAGGAA